MGNSLRHFLPCLSFLLAGSSLCQEDLLEHFFPQQRENNPAEEHAWQELLAPPLDLNHVTGADLLRLPFLTFPQVESFLATRDSLIYFESLAQALQALHLNGDTLTAGRRIFTITLPVTPHPWQSAVRTRLTRPAGRAANWPGSAYRSFCTIRLQHNNLWLGVLAEKDPGEERWDDHRMFHLVWQMEKPHAAWHVMVGNYHVEWGMGLALWSPYGVTVAADVHAAGRRRSRGPRPTLSTNESAVLQGVALVARYRRLEWSGFVSSRRLDATLDADGYVTGLRTSGYHRTASERALAGNLRENLAGLAVQVRAGEQHEIGVLYCLQRFGRPWRPATTAENYYDFSGRENRLFSVAGSIRLPVARTGFEAAASHPGGAAVVLVLAGEAAALSWTVEWHHTALAFHSMRGRGFTDEDATPPPENGYSMGLRVRPLPGWSAEFFHQQARRLWRTRATPLPPQQKSSGARLTWKMNRRAAVRARYCTSQEDDAALSVSPLFVPVQAVRRTTFRLQLEHRPAPALRLRPRLDWARERRPLPTGSPGQAGHTTVTGTALGLELGLAPADNWRVEVRHTLFAAPVPIYQYERDLPGVFTVVGLRENGMRWYIYGHLKIGRKWSLAAKIAATEQELSSLEVRSRTAWGLQLDWSP
ncbi:MAG: hypothetical protein ONB48_06645 [candidate division KSB1 bacterium]|nr:hypothetical protein [candidate division KSB1 bacterium]MDZ7273219.1 hypothetical protein [candidate division KSB1 bacterium]MDZ7285321.1 hypothetical protein [candidate division KSB1 bacterium]MDZ7298353.1 hypothetical protein [candidate division KSB1 bacterium]MDZ7308517.1 hypothetical protein [candidate division KSB1 bacterium]